MNKNPESLNKTHLDPKARRMLIFSSYPIWKSLLIMGWPSIIMMFVAGGYFFTDSILSAQFAGDSYAPFAIGNTIVTGSDQVRMFMNAFGPINALLVAFTLLIAIGASTRVSINLGSKDLPRAKRTIITGSMTSLIISITLIPILIFSARPWMESQYDGAFAKTVGEHGFAYGWVIIASAPLMFFNQLMSAYFRTEARNRQMMIATLLPIGLNLFLDWVFMHLASMGVEGGAWATFVATGVTTLIFCFYIVKNRDHSLFNFKNLFGKFTWLPLFGILLVGIAPFFRNMAQSITQTVEMHVLSDIFPKTITLKKAQLAGVFPIFGLFFPLLFGLSQAGGPIASFNYGARNYSRVKQTFVWSTIYAFILGVIIYLLSTFALGEILLKALGTQPALIDGSMQMLKIIMIAAITFGFAISGMILLSSTDRLLGSLIASTLRGIILFFPMIYLFRFLAIAFPDYEDLFWWFYPSVSLLTSVVIIAMSLYAMKRLTIHNQTLDERITRFTTWVNCRKQGQPPNHQN